MKKAKEAIGEKAKDLMIKKSDKETKLELLMSKFPLEARKEIESLGFKGK